MKANRKEKKMNENLAPQTFVGCPLDEGRLISSPFEIPSECELCGQKIRITVGASRAKQILSATGYACLDCLKQHPEYIAKMS